MTSRSNAPANLCLTVRMALPVAVSAIVWVAAMVGGPARAGNGPAKVEFNRDVRPILSDNCFLCHGPDKPSQGGPAARRPGEAIEAKAFVPGKPDESALVERIFSDHADEQMPPPNSNKKLTGPAEGDPQTLDRAGRRVSAALVLREAGQGGNSRRTERRRRAGACRLAELGLKPSPEADRRTLIRRLYFDLLGLPPTPEEVAAFRRRPVAATPTSDWSIACWQPALRRAHGDWLARRGAVRRHDRLSQRQPRATSGPTATGSSRASTTTSPSTASRWNRSPATCCPTRPSETRVGSAFNRLLLSTEEGGAQAKDYEAAHAHRPRPGHRRRVAGPDHRLRRSATITSSIPSPMRDFYSLGAFFADIKEPAIGKREEGMVVTTPDRREASPRSTLRRRRRGRGSMPWPRSLNVAQQQWEADVLALRRHAARAGGQFPGSPGREDGRAVCDRALKKSAAISRRQGARAAASLLPSKATTLFRPSAKPSARAERESQGVSRCVAEVPGQRQQLDQAHRADLAARQLDGRERRGREARAAAFPAAAERRGTRADAARSGPMARLARQPAHGAHGHESALEAVLRHGAQQSLDDLGAQGEPPANPGAARLAGLRVHGQRLGHEAHGPHHRHQRRLPASLHGNARAAGRRPLQSPARAAERLPARCGARARQRPGRSPGCWCQRSAARASSPISPTVTGRTSTSPPRDYVADKGEGQYRRGLYTWWQRSFLHPSLLAFDAPSREECAAERNRSNIPQQALVLLNDPTYVEAARVFAARILTECQGSPNDVSPGPGSCALQRDPARRRGEDSAAICSLDDI